MKTDYTYAELHSMNVRELRSLLGRMNKEARNRAGRLKAKGYSGAMTTPELKAVRGLKKVDLESAILDYSQAYLRNPRSTIKGMRKFEDNIIGTLNKRYKLNLKRKDLDDFIDYLQGIGELWGSLRYPSKVALDTYEEMDKQGIAGEEINKAFKDYLKTGGKGRAKQKGLERKLTDLKLALKDANEKGEKINTSDDVRSKMKELKKRANS